MASDQDQRDWQQLEELDRALAGTDVSATATEDLCALYKKIRPMLPTIISIVEKIPVYGARIASAMRLLMAIADAYCGISAQTT